MRIALFLATALLSSTQSAMAQFVDVPYQFLSNVQTSRVFFDKTHLQDDVWDIGLNAASNGYGTWTTDGHTAYLIANELGQLDASLPNEFVPSGLVASRAFLEGEFADVEFHKTASNVNGSVFFVRPVLIGPQDCFRAWRVESLHDKQILGSGNIPSAQIEISGAGYPKPLATRDVLTGQFPFRYPDVGLAPIC